MATVQTEIQTRAETELNKIVELFSSQELPNYCKRVLIDAPEKPSSKWSLGNQLLMLLNGTDDARGFYQWKDTKRYVKKGARAFYILAPNVINAKVQDETTKEEKTVQKLVGFHTVPVFRYEDTDGEPLLAYTPRTVPPLLKVAEKWNIKIEYARVGNAYGAFDETNNKIILATEEAQTFFHELGHAAHARIEKTKNGQDPEQEAIAQLTSAILSRIYGYNCDNYTWHYIGAYAGEKSPKAIGTMCLRVLAKVKQVVNLILETELDAKEN